MKKPKEIELLKGNQRWIKLSQSIGGQRELTREMRNKINELIEQTNKNTKLLRSIKSMREDLGEE